MVKTKSHKSSLRRVHLYIHEQLSRVCAEINDFDAPLEKFPCFPNKTGVCSPSVEIIHEGYSMGKALNSPVAY